MIFDAILFVAIGFLSFFIQLFPQADSNIVSQITTTLTSFRSYSSDASWIFPLDLFFPLLTTVIIIEFFINTFKLFRWLASIVTFGIIK